MPSPSPACVEAFSLSLSHPPLIRRLAERRHVALSQNSYCELHDYKSKTNTETVWHYKTFRAVYRPPLAVTEALHTSCDQTRRAGDGRTIRPSKLDCLFSVPAHMHLRGRPYFFIIHYRVPMLKAAIFYHV